MLKPDDVPDEVVFALQDCMQHPDASPWDWIAAALNAWPGVGQLAENDSASIREMAALILPLTQETPDAEA